MKGSIKNKGGASPGAIFVLDDGEYLVKLNMPPGHGPIHFKTDADFIHWWLIYLKKHVMKKYFLI
jgi:hypothetical protein